MTFALIGNQNCGKTTLFNRLTGSNQHVGNFPGVTVDKKEGAVRGEKNVNVVDLPGIYSLSPYTSEEIVTRDFLLGSMEGAEKPDAIINILDATNIERNLYLTLQLLELNMPMVIALNMMDEVRSSGGYIDTAKLENLLDVPVIPISAGKNEGIHELIDRAVKTATDKHVHKKMDFCTGSVHKAIHSIAHIIEDHAKAADVPVFFAATKLTEHDAPMSEQLKLDDSDIDIISHITGQMEQELGTDSEAALADMRYSYIEKLCAECVKHMSETKEQRRSVKIDAILTHRIFAIPIFIAVMGLVFWLTFGVIGAFLSDLMNTGIEAFSSVVSGALSSAGINSVLKSLIMDGIIAGVGSVLGFLPIIVVLFFFLSMLEDSGYMARIAFVMDRLLRRIGLSGRSFVPMLIGFGCSVPAIMATRTLPSERDRKMTIILTPFMSCSAKLPVYAIFTAAFFKEHQALVMIGLYIFGIFMAILSGLLLKSTVFKGKPVPFVMELPAYRLPSLKTSILLMWEKAKDFLKKALTVIFLASIVIWFLQSFDATLSPVTDSSKSLLAAVGSFISPVFKPLGFGDWRFSTALVTGLTAKETILSTLSILFGVSGNEALVTQLSGTLGTPAALSFLIFTLLYMPCVAAYSAVRRETRSTLKATAIMAYQTVTAWVAAFIVYNIIMLF